ncbi:MAG: hypothetical protein GYA62_08495 [Bacteroidales bacterium]|nr:hypothetical protein [Bacteroidales bacterium]
MTTGLKKMEIQVEKMIKDLNIVETFELKKEKKQEEKNNVLDFDKQEILKKFFSEPSFFGKFLGYPDLTQTHGDWIKYLFFNENDCILLAHRNSYKTTCLLIGIILYLIVYPDNTICLIRKNETNAISFLRELQLLYRSERMRFFYEEILKLRYFLPEFTQKSLNLIYKMKNSKERSVEVFGIGGNITGQHFDLIILDDIVTEKDRYSKAERTRTINYIQELKNIKKINGRIVLSGTRWHEQDAIEFLIQQGIKCKEYPVGSVKIKGFTDEKIIELKKSMSLSLYSANYELKHVKSESQLITNIKYYSRNEIDLDDLYRLGKTFMHIDPAYGGDNYTAITVLTEYKNNYYVFGYCFQKHILDCFNEIKQLTIEYNICKIYIENNADKGLIEKELKKMLPVIPVIGYRESQNKFVKITTTIKKYEDKLYFRYNCQIEYLKQIVDYTEFSQFDDAPDSLASLLQKINQSKSSGVFFYDNV